MALFKVFRGKRTDLDQVDKTDGHAYFCTDDGSFWIDYTDEEGQLKRKQVNEEDLKSKSSIINLENGAEIGTIEIKDIEQESYTTPGGIASGVGAVALTGQRGDKDPSKLDPNEDRISEARGLQSFVQGPGNLSAGDWTATFGKDNITSQRNAFTAGGKNFTGWSEETWNKIYTYYIAGIYCPIYTVISEQNVILDFEAADKGGFASYKDISTGVSAGSFRPTDAASELPVLNDQYQSWEDVKNTADYKASKYVWLATFGDNNINVGESNLVGGGYNTVIGRRNIVGGYNNKLNGYYSIVGGLENTVNTNSAETAGKNNTVSGSCHITNGRNNTVSGEGNLTTGKDNSNLGYQGTIHGVGLEIKEGHTAQTVLGYYNDNKSNTLLEIGYGNDHRDRKNIFEVYNDGTVKTEQGTLSTQEYVNETVAAPKTKLNIGRNNTDINAVDSLTVGTHSLNRGYQSAAIGYDAYIGYDSSGNATSKQPTSAVALNWSRANGDYCLSAGYDTEVNHNYSAALNNKTKTGASSQTAIGSYNAAKTTTAFEVGNGSASKRKNAFEVLKAGGFNSYGDSTIDGNLLVNGVSFNNKLDKIETAITSTTTLRSYIINRDGSQGIEDVAYNPDGWAIARYNGGGQLSTVIPTSSNHCVNKKYIDGKLPSGITTSSKKYTDIDSYSSRLICNGIYDLVDKETAIVEKVEGNTAVVENIFENTKFKGVQLSGKNIAYTLEDRTLITVDKNSDLTVADWHFRENGFYLGTSGNDRVYDNKINSYSFDGNSLSASCVSSFYGIGFPIKVKGGELITISFENLSANTRISFREFIDSTTPNGSQSARTVSPFSIQLGANTEWLLLTVQPTAANVDISVSNIQIEYGNAATEFEPYTQKDTEFTFDDYIELGKYDYLLPQENKIVRKTKEFILDGSNVDWMNPSIIGAKIKDFDIESGKDGIIMTGIYDTFVEDTFDYELKSNEYTIYNGNYIAIGKLHADLRETQEYLNANPIKLIYKSTEEVIEYIGCPKLYSIKNGVNEVLICDNTEILPTITTTYKIIENPNYVPTVSYVQNELATKLDKLGGVITGDLVIEGKTNLALGALVSKKGDTTYGLTYDGESFKLGEGTLGENGFTFNEGEGLPIALRSDSSKLTDGHLVSWNSGSNSLVDSGVSVSDIKENIGYKYGITSHINNQGKSANKISFVTAATWNSYIVYLTMRNSEGGYFLSQVFCCNGVGTVSGNNNEELIILYDESTKTYTIQGPQVMNTDGWYDNSIIVASVLKIG